MATATQITKGAAIAMIDEMLRFARGRLAKAALPASIAARDKLFAEVVPELATQLVEYFDGLLERLGAGIQKASSPDLPDPEDFDWTLELLLMGKLLETLYLDMGEFAYATAAETLAVEIRFDLAANATSGIRDRIGEHVKSITDTTRAMLQDRVEEAVARGLSIEQLVRGADGLPGLRELFGNRAQTIALTEVATAHNLASAAAYRESGLVDEVGVLDGAECGWTSHDDEDLADGSTRTIAEMEAYPEAHPNCVRSFYPVVAR